MEFMDVFEKWAERYDDTVFNTSNENEYKDVFEDYPKMLDQIAQLSTGEVLEIGAGTGNLTQHLIRQGLDVTAIDPSEDMRAIANQKEGIHVIEGHFLKIPVEKKFDTIVSSFAFHHLDHQGKQEALNYMKQFLKPNGHIVFIDTLFESEMNKNQIIQYYTDKMYVNLVEDLQTEYYPFKDELEKIVEAANGTPEFEQQNRFAWLIHMKFGH
ncbi:class I SAM-dependent methyltransferase [Staphylococcus coagulans]|uniref:class I SAM-dependent methyltransferase n=1 Tax=Staphylococcus coagulans TaxID=74706 RepID=UPI001BE6A6FC|nr:class I SAM-dependent methyltransferase [Staphylococcus coagulans]MBT2831330.1 class I SAM-dependent methyltransferase [Staphylococcus coagulans]MBT2859825.1 class I SAM-dependent methyltransferase [Staphylococcus coagulans]MBU3874053.1 class I SAM-dependent methyltransferase [Staphylococcus coagulans]UNB48907.1 class I SAM-dependent methyltransferase [Staphylococcus coagulans]